MKTAYTFWKRRWVFGIYLGPSPSYYVTFCFGPLGISLRED